MADSERNLVEEVDYLSGCVFAHDVISLHLAKILNQYQGGMCISGS